MTNILDILSKKHKQWLDYVKSFGCSNDIAEDYVQEMYLKIYSYSQRKDNIIMFDENQVNFYFVYVVLKNMHIDDIRKSKKHLKTDLTIDIAEEIKEYSEVEFYLKKEAKDAWLNRLNKEIESIESYTRQKANLTYIKFIFEKVFIENVNITKLSKEVGITYWSLRNTVLIIKEQIKNEIQSK
jgi:DNA-directed RNA polymerase specialized sigma24 family protein